MRRKTNQYRRETRRRRFRLSGLLRTLIRASRIKTIGAVALVLAAFLGLSAAMAHTYYAMEDASWPRLETVQITGLKRMERRDVLNALQAPRNVNLLQLRQSQMARRVEALPWVRASVVRLEFPSRLVVDIVEREPLALVQTDAFYLTDAQGTLFMQASPEQYPALPLITGMGPTEMQDRNTLSDDTLKVVKALLLALEKAQAWMPISQISQCHWQGDMGFVLYSNSKAIPIQLGKGDFEVKLHRLQRLAETLSGNQWWDLVTRIDLDYKNRAYVKGNFPLPKGI
jgi:cell division septal protein FtsQ